MLLLPSREHILHNNGIFLAYRWQGRRRGDRRPYVRRVRLPSTSGSEGSPRRGMHLYLPVTQPVHLYPSKRHDNKPNIRNNICFFYIDFYLDSSRWYYIHSKSSAMTKNIDWYYWRKITFERLKRKKTGCWFVSLVCIGFFFCGLAAIFDSMLLSR